ncbi:hypothetical protein ISG29_09365 [Nocardioides sp. CBS4Y-1]|uniref:Uncharacterized protein n=1 Tax=Nocardioides acrostichi TaxID=2784339 RepID=A0A930Y634_9ACTN|nr:hypothetical protein [Nocardioides acrostichi]
MWRPDDCDYEAFSAHLQLTDGFPTYLPWPLSPGWAVTDVSSVGAPGEPMATMTCTSGTSALDGPVDVLVVSEEPGAGLGARCAGVPHLDAGERLSEGQPLVKVRLERQQVSLWSVSTSGADGEWDRSVVAGEAGGRWLWIVVRPASAVLLLRDDWILRDISTLGAALLEVDFGGPRPPW